MGRAIIPILAYLASDVTAVPPSLAMSASFRRLLTSSRALATHALKCAVNSRRGDADSDDDDAVFRLLFFFFLESCNSDISASLDCCSCKSSRSAG